MYEQLVEKLIKKDVGAIAGRVVDDTEDIMIPVGIPGYVTCYRCKPVGNDYSVPESDTFEGNVCPDGWFEIQPTCNPPPEEFPWWIVAVVAGVAIVGAVVFGVLRK